MSDEVDELREEIAVLRQDLQGAIQVAKNATQQVSELREELEHERQRRTELEDEVERLTDTTGLLNKVRRNGANDSETRAAICLQTLARQARTSPAERASMDAKGCVNALNSTIDRTNTYDVFRKAEELVDDTDVVWFQKEDRSAPKNSRLVVDLSAGDLPVQVAGHDLTEGASA